MLALRAAATGARVTVETGRPGHWAQVVQAVGGGQAGMTVHDVGRVPPQGASAMGPVLVVRDCGMRPPRGRVDLGAMAVGAHPAAVSQPGRSPADAAGAAHGRPTVSPDEAAELGRVMALSPTDVESLPMLPDGMTLWYADRDHQYVMTQPTDAESGTAGSTASHRLTPSPVGHPFGTVMGAATTDDVPSATCSRVPGGASTDTGVLHGTSGQAVVRGRCSGEDGAAGAGLGD